MSASQIVVVLFALAYLGFLLSTRRRVSFGEFAVAARGIGPALAFSSLAATFVGPAMTMGLVRAGSKVGLLYIPCAALAAINLLLISRFLAARLRQRYENARSIGDIASSDHAGSSKRVRLAVGLTGLALTAAISIVMSKAGGELFNYLFGLDRIVATIAITALVTLYSTFGGIRATIQTDAFQFVCFALILPFLAFRLVADSSLSFGAFAEAAQQATSSAWQAHSALALLSLGVFWLLGSGFDPSYLHRILAAKSPSVAAKSIRYTAFFVLPWMALMYLVGGLSHMLHPELPDSDQLLLQVAGLHLGGIAFGLFSVAMIGVVMSTQDSMLNGAAVVFTNDVLGSLKPELSDQSKLTLSTFATIGVGLVSMAAALFVDSILQAVILIWSVYTPTIAPTIVAAAYLKRRHRQSALASICSGSIVAGAVVLSGWSQQIPAVLAGLIASSLAYTLVHLALEKQLRAAAPTSLIAQSQQP